MIETSVPTLAAARDLLDRFHPMRQTRDVEALPRWLANAEGSLLSSFGTGIKTHLAVVRVALTEPWSNGQTEGQVTKLRLAKRQMYDRAGLDLLRARLAVPA